MDDVNRDAFLNELRMSPLVVSVQASEGSAVDDTETLLKLAQASVAQGIRVLRLEGADRIKRIREVTGAKVVGLIKKTYPGSEVYITPTAAEVDELLATGCEIIALDATERPRPGGVTFRELAARAHAGGTLVMADCDSAQAAVAAIQEGADLVGTTLSGYTENRALTQGPDLDLVREISRRTRTPILAEGRYSQHWQVEAALRIGAAGVVIGGAINDPVKTTRSLAPVPQHPDNVAGVDIGGTWIRFGLFSPDWDLLDIERAPLPQTRQERASWINDRIDSMGAIGGCGISTGGTVDPKTGEVWEAKDIIPDHVGTRFDTVGFALNDGLATAWGHACHPDYAGRRVATLALGTGVGCGFVADGRIWMGPRGEYPRINDLPVGAATFEELLGGASLTPRPTDGQKADALRALEGAVEVIRSTMFPDDIVVCGSVGLSSWMHRHLSELGLKVSPFGADAGLFGAAALVLYPPERIV